MPIESKIFTIPMEDINNQFNKELQQQIDGILPKGHVYSLGYPEEKLLSSGLPNLPIELNAKALGLKASHNYKNPHPFNLLEIKSLPKAIQEPIMIFDSKTRKDSKVILTELKSKGINFIVAIEMNHKKGSDRTKAIEINSIRSLYPKNQINDILVWLKNGLLRYVDKEKASTFTKELQSQFPQKSFENIEASIRNIVNLTLHRSSKPSP